MNIKHTESSVLQTTCHFVFANSFSFAIAKIHIRISYNYLKTMICVQMIFSVLMMSKKKMVTLFKRKKI